MKKPLKRDTNMRTAFIRVSAVNVAKVDNEKLGIRAGDVIKYTLNDIKSIIDEWQKTKDFDYFIIEHYADEENVHFHIVLLFNSSMAKFSTIKRKFPFGSITPCEKTRRCIRYLVHADNLEDKVPYSWSEVITNAPAKLEDAKKSYKEKESDKIKNIIHDIVNGDLQEFEITKIEPDIYIKYEKKIKKAFEYRQKSLKANHTRDVQVVVLQGPPRCGKSLFCKVWADTHNKSICFSSASNDPWQDYGGQDIFVYDDFDYHKTSATDFAKELDVHNNTSVRARYKNPIFIGDTIFICTNIPIIEWFKEEDEEVRQPVFDRISRVLDFQDYKLKFNKNIVPKDDKYRDLKLSYAADEFRRRLRLKNGVARYTSNKIVNLMDIEDEQQREYAFNNIASYMGRLLLSDETDELFIGKGKYREFDLKKYVDFSSDKAKADLFLKQLDDI